jgi:6-phosphogluconolactonase (cycloisomerase 2 family)
LIVTLFALPATAKAAGTVYVTTNQGIAQYAIGAGGRLSPLRPPTVAGGTHEVAVAPDGRSAYATGDDGVFQYSVDPRTGSLSPKSPPFVPAPMGSVDRTLDTFGLAVTPDNKHVYVSASEPHGGTPVLQYDIDQTNGAVSLNTQNVAGGGAYGPPEIAVTPNSKSAYVTDLFGSVIQYGIDPMTGFLSPKSPRSVPAGQYVQDVATTNDGGSAYATTSRSGVFQYSIDPVDGALSPKNPPSAGTGAYGSIAIAPNDQTAYIACAGAICQYDIDPVSGALSPKNPPTVASGTSAVDVAITADGKNAYVTDREGDAIFQYNIDPATGSLSPDNPATVSASDPVGITTWPPHVPATTDHCKQGDWRIFPQFKNQGQCVTFVEHAT